MESDSPMLSKAEMVSVATGTPLSTRAIERGETDSDKSFEDPKSKRGSSNARDIESKTSEPESGPGMRGTSPSGHHFQRGLIERSSHGSGDFMD